MAPRPGSPTPTLAEHAAPCNLTSLPSLFLPPPHRRPQDVQRLAGHPPGAARHWPGTGPGAGHTHRLPDGGVRLDRAGGKGDELGRGGFPRPGPPGGREGPHAGLGTRRDGARRGGTHQVLHSRTLQELLRCFQLQPICREERGRRQRRGQRAPSPTPLTSAPTPGPPSPTRRHGLLEDGDQLHGGGDGGSSQGDGPASRAAAPTGAGGWGSGGKGGWGGGWGSPQAHSPAASGQALRLPFLSTLLSLPPS